MVSFQPPDWGQISKALLDALCVVEALDVGKYAFPPGQPPQGLTFKLTPHGGRGPLSIRKADNFRWETAWSSVRNCSMDPMYKEQLIKELENDSFMRVAFAKDLDDFIEMGIWHGDC
ncbi:MAG: hypothetical protein PHP07_03240 [Eubacteriales bacterium]|nr:hypothetical protein [Eubacteriales bacterium]